MANPFDGLDPIARLGKDLKAAARLLTDDEARFLVDNYYQMQDNRIRADGQKRSMAKDGEPTDVLLWLSNQNSTLENRIKSALDSYVSGHIMGEWLYAVRGIGPVLSAGLLAHIDIDRAPTAGHIWAYAGLDPTKKWEKGQVRPWNAQLKTLCWKIGESFVKVSGHEEGRYGHIYVERKAYEKLRNERGELAEQAAAILEKKKIGKDTDAYAAYIQGKLPDAHIHARACRYAVKIFLSHFWQVWREKKGLDVVKPFAIEHLGHAHFIEPPRI